MYFISEILFRLIYNVKIVLLLITFMHEKNKITNSALEIKYFRYIRKFEIHSKTFEKAANSVKVSKEAVFFISIINELKIVILR